MLQLWDFFGVQFRDMGIWPLRTHWGFGFGTLWCSVQADGSLISGPTGVSALIHFGVQSRVMGVWSLRTHYDFGFGTLWG